MVTTNKSRDVLRLLENIPPYILTQAQSRGVTLHSVAMGGVFAPSNSSEARGILTNCAQITYLCASNPRFDFLAAKIMLTDTTNGGKVFIIKIPKEPKKTSIISRP